MSREKFRRAIFDLIELLTKTELRETSRRLILEYFNESTATSSAVRARETVERYTQTELPQPHDIVVRSRGDSLTRVDRMVVAMDREAMRFDRAPQ